jgi:hypothetical protein
LVLLVWALITLVEIKGNQDAYQKVNLTGLDKAISRIYGFDGSESID